MMVVGKSTIIHHDRYEWIIVLTIIVKRIKQYSQPFPWTTAAKHFTLLSLSLREPDSLKPWENN